MYKARQGKVRSSQATARSDRYQGNLRYSVHLYFTTVTRHRPPYVYMYGTVDLGGRRRWDGIDHVLQDGECDHALL